MKKARVYLIRSQKRLVVSFGDFSDDYDYEELFQSVSNDINIAQALCNSFCVGYIVGNQYEKVINKVSEFELR